MTDASRIPALMLLFLFAWRPASADVRVTLRESARVDRSYIRLTDAAACARRSI